LEGQLDKIKEAFERAIGALQHAGEVLPPNNPNNPGDEKWSNFVGNIRTRLKDLRAKFQEAYEPRTRLREDARQLHTKAAATLREEDDEGFDYQATLLLADVSKLAVHFGASEETDEIIAALDIARAQFFARTPRPVVEALGEVFSILLREGRLTTESVDEALDRLAAAGVDLNYPLRFAKDDVEDGARGNG